MASTASICVGVFPHPTHSVAVFRADAGLRASIRIAPRKHEQAAQAAYQQRDAEDEALALTRLAPQMAQRQLIARGKLARSRKVLPQPLRPHRLHLDLAPAHVLVERAQAREL